MEFMCYFRPVILRYFQFYVTKVGLQTFIIPTHLLQPRKNFIVAVQVPIHGTNLSDDDAMSDDGMSDDGINVDNTDSVAKNFRFSPILGWSNTVSASAHVPCRQNNPNSANSLKSK